MTGFYRHDLYDRTDHDSEMFPESSADRLESEVYNRSFRNHARLRFRYMFDARIHDYMSEQAPS